MPAPPRPLLAATAVGALVVLLAAPATPARAGQQATRPAAPLTLISVRDDESPAESASRLASATSTISRTGRYVVFQSRDPLVPALDTNSSEDVYLRDTVEHTTRLVSRAGGSAVGGSGATVSADGRHVAFLSSSASLSPADTDDRFDVFVRDMVTGKVTLASRTDDGATRRPDCDEAVISADGRHVAFLTSARLSAADHDPRGVEAWKRLDVYLRDLGEGTTELISVRRNGQDFVGPVGLGGVAAHGGIIGFTVGRPRGLSQAPGGFYVRDRSEPGSTLIWRDRLLAGGTSDGAPSISADGRYAAFASDSPALDPESSVQHDDVAVVDLRTHRRWLVSVGRHAHDAHGDSWAPVLSREGRYVAFVSDAWNIVRHDDNDAPDVFWQPLGHQARMVSRGGGGAGDLASGYAGGVGISGNGRRVTFDSLADDLVPGDTNNSTDVFVWRRPMPG